ncbi:Arm DNA-binding domain-containing protein [Bradyrhizobium sp. LjRoot220]|uniref:tyrosine-type recombinase/integrase n=1 Tax=Bradyrhizobium sp. LjRoot220 TaxID=3342284 RepID=UPI003ECDD9E5
MLTDTACRNARPYKMSDGGGLRLVVTPPAKLWNMAYRFAGKSKKLSFGAYPALTLAEARTKRDAAKVQLAGGIDPGVTRQEAKRAHAAALTFGEWADAWLEKERQLWDQKTIDGKARNVGYLKAEFGTRLIPAVKRPDVLLYLKKIERAGTLEKRDRIRSTGEQICVYADVEGTDYNPFRNLSK